MSDSPVDDFIAYLKGNPEMRKEVERLERSIAYAIQREDELIAAIAAEAGFDVSGWNGRVRAAAPAAPEAASGLCCGFMTSDIALLAETLDS